MNPCFHAENTPWSWRKQEIRSARSQCQQGTVASATVSLNKETQSQKHWAACSLGHRLSPLGYRKFVYCPECHDLLVCQKQAIFSHQKSSSPVPCGIQREITLTAGNSSPRWVLPSHAGEPSVAPQAAQSPLSLQQLWSVKSIGTGSRFCVFFFSFFYQIHCVPPKYSWTWGLQKRIQSWVGRGGKIWEELGRSELYKTLRELAVTNWGERSPERRIKHCLLSAPQGFSCAASDCQSWPAPSTGRDPEVSFTVFLAQTLVRWSDILPEWSQKQTQWAKAWESLLTDVYQPSLPHLILTA